MYHIRAPNDITDITACENGKAESQFVSVFPFVSVLLVQPFSMGIARNLSATCATFSFVSKKSMPQIGNCFGHKMRPTATGTLSGFTSHLPYSPQSSGVRGAAVVMLDGSCGARGAKVKFRNSWAFLSMICPSFSQVMTICCSES